MTQSIKHNKQFQHDFQDGLQVTGSRRRIHMQRAEAHGQQKCRLQRLSHNRLLHIAMRFLHARRLARQNLLNKILNVFEESLWSLSLPNDAGHQQYILRAICQGGMLDGGN